MNIQWLKNTPKFQMSRFKRPKDEVPVDVVGEAKDCISSDQSFLVRCEFATQAVYDHREAAIKKIDK